VKRTEHKSKNRDKILIGSVLTIGALLIFGLLWLIQHANPGAPPTEPAQPAAVAKPAVAVPSARDKELERLETKQKEMEKELEQTKLIRDKHEQDAQEAMLAERRRQEADMTAQQTKLRHHYAETLFEGDEEAAKTFITELENVRNELDMLPEDAKERTSKEETYKFVASHLIKRIGNNAVLSEWLKTHGRKAEELMPGLAQKKPKAPDGTPDFSNYAAFGSGFWVSADGWLLTNSHVVGLATTVDLRMRDGTIIQAKIVKTDTVNDLALLKASSAPSSWLPVSKVEAELKLGQTVFTIGYPNPEIQGVEPKFTDGRISSVTGINDSKNHYQTTVPIQHGNSGGPLVDLLTGWVVGIVDARLEDQRSGAGVANVSYAIKSNVVCTFIDSVPEAKAAIERKPATFLKKGDERAVIDRVKDAGMLIMKPH